MRIFLILAGLFWFGALALRAADRYVVAPGTIANGGGGVYTDWSIAATQIQWAVDLATIANDTVWVSNGVYVLTNQIVVTNAITLRSTNGPAVTVINGGYVAGSATTNNRCLWMSNAAAFVSGFTISNGAVYDQHGGGVWMYKGILSNCYLTTNTAFSMSVSSHGGGIYAYGGTVTACRAYGNLADNLNASQGGSGAGMGLNVSYISNCVVSNNLVTGGGLNPYGGGIAVISAGRIRSSVICNNRNVNGFAGGLRMDYSTILEDSTVANNQAAYVGGITVGYGGTITNCVVSNNVGSFGSVCSSSMSAANSRIDVYNTTIVANSADNVLIRTGTKGMFMLMNCVIENSPGCGVIMESTYTTTNSCLFNCIVRGNTGKGVDCYGGTIRNCLISGNSSNGLLIRSSCQTGLISSCTIASNMSANAGAGIRIEATAPNILSISSCIIYSNGVSGTNDVYDACAPTNLGALQYSCVGTNPGFTGAGIIAANPQFKNFTGGDYRLSANSPCINAGTNQTWMTNSYDLDGRARIRYGRVDMGAYEAIYDGTVYRFGF